MRVHRQKHLRKVSHPPDGPQQADQVGGRQASLSLILRDVLPLVAEPHPLWAHTQVYCKVAIVGNAVIIVVSGHLWVRLIEEFLLGLR